MSSPSTAQDPAVYVNVFAQKCKSGLLYIQYSILCSVRCICAFGSHLFKVLQNMLQKLTKGTAVKWLQHGVIIVETFVR